MVPFLGRPLLYHLVSDLRESGFTDLIFSSEGRDRDIRRYFADGEAQGLRIRYMPPARWDGSAGVVGAWLDQTGTDTPDTLIVIYGDSLLQTDMRRFLNDHRSSGAPVSILGHRALFEKFLFRDDSRRTNFGVMELAPNGDILDFDEKPLLTDLARSDNLWANAAVYAFDRSCFERIRMRKPGESDFGYDVFPALLKEGVRLRGADIGQGYRLDIGTLDLYLTAQMAALTGIIACDPGFREVAPRVWCDDSAVVGDRASWSGPTIVGPAANVAPSARLDHVIIGAAAVIGADAVINHSVILDGAQIGRGTVITRSIVGFGCRVGDGAPALEDSVLGELSEVWTQSRLMSDQDLRGVLGRA
jgi:mannose-1-phosphate guanylyltransferase